MKRFWISCAILVAMIATLSWNVHHLKSFIEPLNEKLEAAAVLAEAEDWQAAERLTGDVYNAWQERRTYLHVTLRHANIDDIYVLMEEVIAYLEQRKIGEYMACNQALITELNLLCEMEELNLHNVL